MASPLANYITSVVHRQEVSMLQSEVAELRRSLSDLADILDENGYETLTVEARKLLAPTVEVTV